MSNVGETASAVTTTAGYLEAIGFTTGSNAAGYTLTGINFRTASGQTALDATAAGKIRAQLWSATISGAPNAKLYDLLAPSYVYAGSREVVFVAPASTTLAANTKYFALIYTTDSTAYATPKTSSNDEDGAGFEDWSIDDVVHYQNSNAPGAT